MGARRWAIIDGERVTPKHVRTPMPLTDQSDYISCLREQIVTDLERIRKMPMALDLLCASPQVLSFKSFNLWKPPMTTEQIVAMSSNPSAIDMAIASVPVGSIAQVTPDFSFFRVGNYWGIDWTPRMHWHAPTQQLILCEHRLTSRVVAFADATGLWRDLPIGGLPAGSGHWYGWSAEDGAGSIYAKSQKLDIATETWTAIPNPPTTNGSNGTMYAWQSNVNRLARYGGDAQRWQEYTPATNTWKVYKNYCGHGQHALVEFHAAHGCSIMLGGNKTDFKASLMLPGGTQSALPNCPGTVSMDIGSWVVAHPDGGWMARLFLADATSRIFHIRPGDPAWADLGPFPKLGLGYQSAAIDPARRVVLLATTTGLQAWKFPAV